MSDTPALSPGDHLIVVEDEYDLEDSRARDADGSQSLLEEYRREDMRARLVCTGIDDACRYWTECVEHTHPNADDLDADPSTDPVSIEGVDHRWLDGSWMTRTDSCVVLADGYESGEVVGIPKAVGYVPGVYPIYFEWDEGVYVEVDEANPAVSDAEVEHALATVAVDPCTVCGRSGTITEHPAWRLCDTCRERLHGRRENHG